MPYQRMPRLRRIFVFAAMVARLKSGPVTKLVRGEFFRIPCQTDKNPSQTAGYFARPVLSSSRQKHRSLFCSALVMYAICP